MQRFLYTAVCLFGLNLCVAQSEQIIETSTSLTIAVIDNNPPFSMVLPNGKPTGLYVDFWKTWSKVSGQRIEFLIGSYPENIVALKNGKADFHSGLFINKEREQWAVFSLPIDRVETALFFNGDAKTTPSLENLKGKSIGVGKDTFQESYLRENFPEVNLVSFTNPENTINSLLNSEIDALISESPFINAQLGKLGINGAFVQREDKVFSNTTHALIPKKNSHLIKLINDGIKSIPINTIIKLEKKWLPGFPAYFETLQTSILSSLTIKEQQWLATHNSFSLGIDPLWPPFEFVNKEGIYSGISAEYVERISKSLSLDLNAELGNSWMEVLTKIKNGKLDILPGVTRSPAREKFLSFSKPYVNFPNVIVTRKDSKYVQNLDDLSGEIIAVVDGYRIGDRFRNHHKGIQLKIVNDISEGLSLVQNKTAFGYVDNIAAVTHDIRAFNREDLKVAIYTQYTDSLSFAVRKDLEPLISIINKAIDNIPSKERKAITNSWLSVQVNVGTDIFTIVKWGIPTLGLLFLVIFSILYSNRRMKEEINNRISTELKLKDAKNIAIKANRLKDDFLANMSHEIRTPMNAVMGMSQLLGNTNLDGEQQEYVSILKNSSSSLLLLINDILDLSKIESGKLELEYAPFDLNDLISSVLQQTKIKAASSNISLYLNIDKKVPLRLVGDKLRLGQILLNLISNAEKFTKQGAITIGVEVKEIKESTAVLYFIIRDTGIGMTQEQTEKLFRTYGQADASTTREFGGTGLGLSICKNLCELMGGKIWANSEYGKGSQFHFTCNLAFSKLDHKEIESNPLLAQSSLLDIQQQQLKDSWLKKLSGKKILLVDDNKVNLTIAKKLLLHSGMTVVTAENGEESIKQLETEIFDCVLMDIRMPVMDGYQATEIIRKNSHYCNIPIIALSANAMEAEIQKGKKAGMNAHVSKPIDLNILLRTLSEYIHS